MARAIVDGVSQLVFGISGETLAGRTFLGGTDLDDQMTPGNQVIPGTGDELIEDGIAARAAIERQARLVVADARG